MSKFKRICESIRKLSPDIEVREEHGCIVLRGEVENYETIVKAGQLAVDKKRYYGVVNDIKLKGFEAKPHLPNTSDDRLDSRKPDILIIGGGITGCAAARELSKWKLDIMLVEKGPDVASGASCANGGVVHVGVNFSKKSQKHHYNNRGNSLYGQLCQQLDVPFEQKGQVMLICKPWEKMLVWLLRLNSKRLGIPGVCYLDREHLLQIEPCIPSFAIGGMYMPTGGITSPHEMTVALAENAAENGAEICLNTAVLDMDVEDGLIKSVATSKGRIYPKLVINASGVYADIIAEMAKDRTFTIHPRRGTDIIMDKKAGYMVKTSMAKAPFTILPYQNEEAPRGLIKRIKFLMGALMGSSHTKGVGLIHSVHGNMLVGPNAIETPDREDTLTRSTEVEDIIRLQQHIAEDLKFSDVIAYFTGVRAATYEEDFVVQRGIFTNNILEAAGIQSPGVTAAPAIALDIEKWSVEYLQKFMSVERNEAFDPVRKGTRRLSEMGDEERDALIRKNPDYGVIVCRCEEVSKGEIIDALNSPVCVPTVDGIKKRLRPGMGRCQGGFCTPLVMQIIADYLGVPLSKVKKSTEDSLITFGETKGAEK